jgi:hypothetical protein
MSDEVSVEGDLAIQDRVLAETEILGRPALFRTVIVKVCADELWLGMATPDHRLEAMLPDQSLRLTVARPGGALVGRSGFLRPLGGSKSRIFAVVRPAALERVQRRAHVRYNIELPIHFRNIDPATREPRGKAASATTLNISPGGLLLKTEMPLTIGQELDMVLPLSGGDRVSMNGVVTRAAADEAADSGPNGVPGSMEVGIKFSRITTVDQDRILRFILMLEHRRRELAARAPVVPVAEPIAAVPGAAAAAPRPVAIAPRIVAPAVAPAAPAPTAAPKPTAAPAVPTPTPARPAAPAPVALPPIDPNQPLISVGLHLCEGSDATGVRQWFDSLMPFDRIELLSLLQTNMAGGAVPGATEAASVRPLAVALGLLAA